MERIRENQFTTERISGRIPGRILDKSEKVLIIVRERLSHSRREEHTSNHYHNEGKLVKN